MTDPDTATATTAFSPSEFLSERATSRVIKHFWENVPHVSQPHNNPIALIGGMPNHGFFPVQSAHVNLRDKPFSTTATANSFNINPTQSDPANLGLAEALQYSDDQGMKPLLNQIRQFVSTVVKPISPHWEVCCTQGGSDGIGKTFDIIINPGDVVLFEEFSFTPVLSYLAEKGGIPIPIKLNNCFPKDGSLPKFDYVDELTNMLQNWSTLYPNLPLPKLLYTIPNGHNPLGLAQSIDHKRQIYQLATTYNFIILEDEPYSYLNFTPADEQPNLDLTTDQFINSLNPSYLTLDNVGRVIRTETFSKVYSPGLRLGFTVHHKDFLKYYTDAAFVTNRGPNGYSQMFVNNTISALGGINGWIKWIISVRNEYLIRKNAFVNAITNSKAASSNYISAIDPNCGMFVAIVVNVEKHPQFNGNNHQQIMDLFYIAAAEAGVLAVLSRNMCVDTQISSERACFLRCSVSYVENADVLKEAAERFSIAAVNIFEKK